MAAGLKWRTKVVSSTGSAVASAKDPLADGNQAKVPDTRTATGDNGKSTEHPISAELDKKLMKIIANQSKIMNKLTIIQLTVNKSKDTTILSNEQQSQSVEDHTSNEHSTYSYVSTFRSLQPADTVQEFDQLEANLGHEEFFAKVVSDMKMICGSTGICRGLESCYTLVDYFLTRSLIMQCSWGGSSKTDVLKVPFKTYKNFRKCFYTLVRETDSTFTEEDCDGFFKNILKNSRKRFMSKGLRKSTPRRRLKKSDWNLKKELIQRMTDSYDEQGRHVFALLEEDNENSDIEDALEDNCDNDGERDGNNEATEPLS